LALSLGATPALAQDRSINPVADYANVLRVMNPHLPDWQRRKYAASVLANAERTRVDPRFIMAIVTVESSWQSNAVSHSGARGLGQLMPTTAARLAVNARDAAENLRGTASYLRSLLDRFRGQQNWFEKAIAGYNAGPNAVKRYGGIPPYAVRHPCHAFPGPCPACGLLIRVSLDATHSLHRLAQGRPALPSMPLFILTHVVSQRI